MTAGQLALHIAEVPGRVLKLALADEATRPDFRFREQPNTLREVLDLLVMKWVASSQSSGYIPFTPVYAWGLPDSQREGELVARRRTRGNASDSSSDSLGGVILALAKATRFGDLKARLSTVDQLDLTSDAVLETFFRSVQARDIELVDRFFALGVDPNTRWRQNSALGCAARLGNAGLVAALVDRGCDVNGPGLNDNVPVVDACASAPINPKPSLRPRFEETVTLLLRLGSDPNQKNMFGMTAVDYACERFIPGNVGLVKLLLEGGARVACALEQGSGCLNAAAIIWSPELMRLLLEHGGNANCQDCFGTAPLMLAAVHDREDHVKLLLEKGADVGATNREGLSALDLALKHESRRVLPLLEAARDEGQRSHSGKSVLLQGQGDGHVFSRRPEGDGPRHNEDRQWIAGKMSQAQAGGRLPIKWAEREPGAMLEKWHGTYRFDPANTARLLAGSFKERFIMKEGSDQAVKDCFEEDDPEIDQIRLHIEADAICLANDAERERLPVLRCWEDAGRDFVEVLSEGRPMQFEQQAFGGGCLRLYNPSDSLSENVWSPVSTASDSADK